MNEPLQQRAGKNPAPRIAFLSIGETARSRFLQANDPDTILLTGSSREQRVVPLRLAEAFALAFNFTGGAIDYELLFVDDQSNEYKIDAGPIADGDRRGFYFAEGPAALLPGEKLVFRITSGNPSAGNGCNLSIDYQTISEDIVVVRKDIPGTSVIDLFSPAPGEVWIPASAVEEGETLLICNGDSIAHTFDIYINNGIKDILVAKAQSIGAGEVNDIGHFDNQGSFSYGQTFKVQMLQPRDTASSRILFAALLTKAALSKDSTP